MACDNLHSTCRHLCKLPDALVRPIRVGYMPNGERHSARYLWVSALARRRDLLKLLRGISDGLACCRGVMRGQLRRPLREAIERSAILPDARVTT